MQRNQRQKIDALEGSYYLEGLSDEEQLAFTLGFEFHFIVDMLCNQEDFETPIHPQNVERVGNTLEDLGMFGRIALNGDENPVLTVLFEEE